MAQEFGIIRGAIRQPIVPRATKIKPAQAVLGARMVNSRYPPDLQHVIRHVTRAAVRAIIAATLDARKIAITDATVRVIMGLRATLGAQLRVTIAATSVVFARARAMKGALAHATLPATAVACATAGVIVPATQASVAIVAVMI